MATTDEATPLQALLALYGALDKAVTSGGGAEVEATVERYLPGSTGPNAGWYDELLGFLASGTYADPGIAEQPPATPELGDALTVLQNIGSPTERGATPPALTPVQLSRMVYALGALSHLPDTYLPDGWEAEFSQVLALVQPEPMEQEGYQSANLRGTPPTNDDLLDLLRTNFGVRADFPALMKIAKGQGWVDALTAGVPLCEAKAKWVRGQLCAVLTTEFVNTDVTLDDVKNVMDPLNWPRCLPFFCAMDAKDDRPDGWNRVLEHVSVTCTIAGTPQMVTPLKYLKGPASADPAAQSTAFIDYALDDNPVAGEQGDGLMVVDDGFIRMTSTATASSSPGVRVRTRKVAGFRNLAFFPAALFACVVGYGDASEGMVLTGIATRANDSTGWTDWKASNPTAGGGGTPSGKPGDNGDPAGRAMTLAVNMLNECIDDLSKKSASLAGKWATGAMPIAETMTYSADVAARLATDPWRYLERLRNPTQGSGK